MKILYDNNFFFHFNFKIIILGIIFFLNIQNLILNEWFRKFDNQGIFNVSTN